MKRQTVAQWMSGHIIVGDSTSCWPAIAKSRNQPGWHVRFKAEGKVRLAHREAWIAARGEIPEGLFVLHKCDNPICCNPDHLFLGTQADNVLDMIQKGRARMGTNPRRGKTGIESPFRKKIDADMVVNLYLNGMRQRDIAKIVGCSDVTLGKALRSSGRVDHLLGRGTKKKIRFGARI